jgi:hypothetical protein
MEDQTNKETMHLAGEAVERIGMGGEPGPDETTHLASCSRCRREIAEVGSLQVRFATLAVLTPSAGFADRVMARIQLPVPIWVRALDGVRSHRLRAAAAIATLIAAVAGSFTWLTRFPQVTPVTMARLLWEQGTGLVWQFVVSAGRMAYDSGLYSVFEAFRADLTTWSAVGALATLAIVGTGSLLMLMRLMDLSPRRIRTGVGRIG